MKALVFDDRLRLEENVPLPVPAAGEALIRVTMAGICNTDMEITRGYMGFSGILGHEFTGVVEDIRGNFPGWTGKRVVGEINCGCGVCEDCRNGMERHCRSRTVLGIAGRDGCFAQYLALPVKNLHEIPSNVSDESAVFCEPLAAAFEIMEQLPERHGKRILVMGDGKLGLLAGLMFRYLGIEAFHLGRHAGKLALLGIPAERIFFSEKEISEKSDVVVEATGTLEGFASALGLVKPRGTVVLKSTVADLKPVDLAPIVINEVTVLGSRCGLFAPALEALGNGLDVKPFISRIFPFGEAEEAFQYAREKGVVKVLLDMRQA